MKHPTCRPLRFDLPGQYDSQPLHRGKELATMATVDHPQWRTREISGIAACSKSRVRCKLDAHFNRIVQVKAREAHANDCARPRNIVRFVGAFHISVRVLNNAIYG